MRDWTPAHASMRQLRKRIYNYRLWTEPWDTAKYWWVEFRRWCWKIHDRNKWVYFLFIFPFIAMFFMLASGFPGGEGFPSSFLQPVFNVVGQGGLDPTGKTDGSAALQAIVTNLTTQNPGNTTRLYFPAGTYILGAAGSGSFGSVGTPQQSTGQIIMFGDGASATFLRPSVANCKLISFQMPGEIWDMTISGLDPTSTFFASGCVTMTSNYVNQNSIATVFTWPTLAVGIASGSTVPATNSLMTIGGAGWQGGPLNNVNAFPLTTTVAAGSAGSGIYTFSSGGSSFNNPPTGGTFKVNCNGGSFTANWNDSASTFQTNFTANIPSYAGTCSGVGLGQAAFPGNANGGGYVLVSAVPAPITITNIALTGTGATNTAAAGIQINFTAAAGAQNVNNLVYGTSQNVIARYALRRVVLRDGKPGGVQICDINDTVQPCGGYNTATGVALIGAAGISGTFNLTVQGIAVNGNSATISAASLQTAIQATGGANAGVVCFGGPLPGTAGVTNQLPSPIYIANVPSYSVVVTVQPTGGTITAYNPWRGEVALMSDPTTSNIGITDVYLEDIVCGPNTNTNQEVLHCTAQRVTCVNQRITGLTGRGAMNLYGFDRAEITNVHCDYFAGAGSGSYVNTIDFTIGGASETIWSGCIVDDTSTSTQQNMVIGTPYCKLDNFQMSPIGSQRGGNLSISQGGAANDSVYAYVDISNSTLGNGLNCNTLPLGQLNCTNCTFGPYNTGTATGGLNFNNQSCNTGPVYLTNCTFNLAGGSLASYSSLTGFLIKGNSHTIYQVNAVGGGVARNNAGQFLFSGIATQGNTTYCNFKHFAGVTDLQQTATTPPISGTSYGPFVVDTTITVNVTSTNTAGTVAIAITPPALPGGGAASAVNLPTWTPTILEGTTLNFRVPAGWTYKLTATNVTLGTLVAMG